MNSLQQVFFGICALAISSFFLRRTVLGFLLLVSVPILSFYQFSYSGLFFSIFLGLILYKLLRKGSNSAFMVLFFAVLGFSLIVNHPKTYKSIAIENVTNSQRGEHANYQDNLLAKILHNKSTVLVYYLSNLNSRLSLSTVFASGNYSNFSKYLPLGLLFPWYLFAFLKYIKKNYLLFASPKFIIASTILLSLSSVLDSKTSEPFVFAIIWFIAFLSVEEIESLPKKIIFSTVALNLIYLGIFLLPINTMWNI